MPTFPVSLDAAGQCQVGGAGRGQGASLARGADPGPAIAAHDAILLSLQLPHLHGRRTPDRTDKVDKLPKLVVVCSPASLSYNRLVA